MSEDTIVPVPPSLAASAWTDNARYEALYQQSVEDPEGFWAEQGRRLDWLRPYSQVKDVSYTLGDVHIRWYADGQLNVAANCIDRHLETRGGKTAILWEGDEPDQHKAISYRELYTEVCRLANGLRALGVGKGDGVVIYLPMVPEAAIAMLACARLGAVHSVVFGGFAAHELAIRVDDAKPKVVLTASCGIEIDRVIPYMPLVSGALKQAAHLSLIHISEPTRPY